MRVSGPSFQEIFTVQKLNHKLSIGRSHRTASLKESRGETFGQRYFPFLLETLSGAVKSPSIVAPEFIPEPKAPGYNVGKVITALGSSLLLMH